MAERVQQLKVNTNPRKIGRPRKNTGVKPPSPLRNEMGEGLEEMGTHPMGGNSSANDAVPKVSKYFVHTDNEPVSSLEKELKAYHLKGKKNPAPIKIPWDVKTKQAWEAIKNMNGIHKLVGPAYQRVNLLQRHIDSIDKVIKKGKASSETVGKLGNPQVVKLAWAPGEHVGNGIPVLLRMNGMDKMAYQQAASEGKGCTIYLPHEEIHEMHGEGFLDGLFKASYVNQEGEGIDVGALLESQRRMKRVANDAIKTPTPLTGIIGRKVLEGEGFLDGLMSLGMKYGPSIASAAAGQALPWLANKIMGPSGASGRPNQKGQGILDAFAPDSGVEPLPPGVKLDKNANGAKNQSDIQAINGMKKFAEIGSEIAGNLLGDVAPGIGDVLGGLADSIPDTDQWKPVWTREETTGKTAKNFNVPGSSGAYNDVFGWYGSGIGEGGLEGDPMVPVKISLSPTQRRKLEMAASVDTIKEQKEFAIRLKFADLKGNDTIYVSPDVYKEIVKRRASAAQKGLDILIGRDELKEIERMKGQMKGGMVYGPGMKYDPRMPLK